MLRRSYSLAGAVIGAAAAALVAGAPALACSASNGRPIASFGGGDGSINVPWYTAGVGQGGTFLGQPLVHLDVTPAGQPGVGSFRTLSLALSNGSTGDDTGDLVIRGYRSDGTPDPGYAQGRALVLRTWTTTGIYDSWAGAGADGQRRLVVAKRREDLMEVPTLLLRRITAAGAVDASFAPPSGARITSPGTSSEFTVDLGFAVRSSGWVWGCGWSQQTPGTVRLTEIDPQGRIHAQRAVALPVGVGQSVTSACRAVGAATDGSALISVDRKAGDVSTPALLKITRAGAVDTAFGTDGYASWDGAGAERIVTAPDGSYLVGAHAQTGAGTHLNQVVHVLAGGALDPGWGTGGVADVGHTDVALSALSAGSGGTAYVGLASSTPSGRPGRLRLAPDGRLDTAYARCGWLEIPSGGGAPSGPAGVVEVRSGVTVIGMTAPRATTSAGTVPGSRVDKRTS